jgi:flavin reductase (DIM6/NTAB) family NADH-FMN oxidoreductase RutF
MAADMSPNPTVDGFRVAMRRLASGVSILTAHEAGCDFAMTATAVCSLSATPPRLIVCVNQSASLHDPMARTLRFGVNIMAAADEPLVRACSGGASPLSRVNDANWVRSPDAPPRCKAALAYLVCDVLSVQPFDSHSLFVAAVAESRIPIGEPHAEALVYLNGQFAGLAPQTPATGRSS